MSTNFEELPDDILLIIVSYIACTERFQIFGTLNERFRSIVKRVGIGIDKRNATEQIPNSLISDYCSSLIYYHLEYQVPWINLRECPQLRSLVLSNANEHQLTCIQSEDMPKLAHLSITTAVKTSVTAHNLALQVFANQFPRLKSICFAQFNFEPQVKCAQIQHVEINITRLEDFDLLLQLLPNLIFLKTKITSYHSWNLRLAGNKVSIIHPRLRHLNVKIHHNIYAFEIEWLLKSLPQLRYLEVGSFEHIDGRIVDFDRLLALFNTYTPKLQKYKPFYPIPAASYMGINYLNRVPSISPLFANITWVEISHYNNIFDDVFDGGDGGYRRSYIIKG